MDNRKLYKIIPGIPTPVSLIKNTRDTNAILTKETFISTLIVGNPDNSSLFIKIYTLAILEHCGKKGLSQKEVYEIFLKALITYIKVNITAAFKENAIITAHRNLYNIFNVNPASIFSKYLVDKTGNIRPFIKLEYGKNILESMSESLVSSFCEAIILEEYNYEDAKKAYEQLEVAEKQPVNLLILPAALPMPVDLTPKRKAIEIETGKK